MIRRGGVMLRRRHEMVGCAAMVVGLALVAIIDQASAQYYCDERYPSSCAPQRQAPPPPLPFPFSLFKPREYAPPPEPALRPVPQQPGYQAPQRPSYNGPPLDPTVARQYAALY